jgi:hypothetical protein
MFVPSGRSPITTTDAPVAPARVDGLGQPSQPRLVLAPDLRRAVPDEASGQLRPGRLGRAVEHPDQQILDAALQIVGELGAVGAEKLDAVVVVRIVGGGHHRAGNPVAATHVRHAGRRQLTQLGDPATGRGHAGGERRRQHRRRDAGVPADEPVTLAEHGGRGAAESERHLGREFGVRLAAQAVGAEADLHHGSRF